MTDREKVIKGLECCQYSSKSHCDGCPFAYEGMCGTNDCTSDLASEAIVLLKEQEPREPHYTTLAYIIDGTEMIVHHPECPRCIENGLALWDAEIERGQAYCKRCGQAVKWND